jgi:capsule polysaccharide export protein KpsE/RkpR
VSERYRKAGQAFSDLRNKSQALDQMSEHATGLHNKIQRDLLTHQLSLQSMARAQSKLRLRPTMLRTLPLV